jgi:peptide/nickel transport system substrate-binding protein
MSSKSGLGRLLITGAAVATLAVTALPMNSLASPAQQGRTRHFNETNLDVSGRFLDVWESGRSYGDSLYINGLPLTDMHDETSLTDGKIYKMQWFERARFEAHPENKSPYDVLLGLLGVFAAEGRTDTPFKGIDNPGSGSNYVPQTRHTVGDSSEGGQAILKFWQQKGGVPQFGYPLSQPFQEVTRETDPKVAGKSFLVQYFERQRFEYHPENKGTPFEVLLGRLGAEQKDQVPVVEKTLGARPNPVDTLRVGRGQDPGTLNPLVDNTLVGSNFFSAVFNSLTKRNQQDQVLPDLLAYVPTLENGGAYYVGTGDDKHLVVKYKLKRGVKWFDGQELTSNDVIYTYKLYLDPNFPTAARQNQQKFSKIDNPDPYTIIANYLTWKEAQALIARDKDTYGFMQSFVDDKVPVTDPQYNEILVGYVLPQHLLSKTAPADIPALDWSHAPWGSGPYHVTKFDEGQAITMEINPNYNVTPNKPVIKTIYSPLSSDNKQLPVGVDTGNLDLTTSESLTPDLLTQLKSIEAKGKAKAIVLPYYGWDHIDFNTSKEPFNDVRLRQAVAYALDMNAINQALFGGAITLMTNTLPPTHWASPDNPANVKAYPDIANQLPKYTFNVDKANALLDDAGWKMNASTGIREKNGKPLKVTYLTTTKAYRISLAAIQQQMLKKVGIDSVPNPRPASEVFAEPPDGPLYTGSYGDYGMVEFGWGGGTDEPFTVGMIDTTQIPSDANGHSGQNDMFYSNPNIDKFFRAGAAGLGHTPDRVKNYMQGEVEFMKNVPSIPLFAIPSIWLASNNLKNLEVHPGGTLIEWQNWYMSK